MDVSFNYLQIKPFILLKESYISVFLAQPESNKGILFRSFSSFLQAKFHRNL